MIIKRIENIQMPTFFLIREILNYIKQNRLKRYDDLLQERNFKKGHIIKR